MFRKGDARSNGGDEDAFIPIATNYKEHVGRIWLVPKSNTSQNSIDIFGGLGVCLTKENIVTSGAITRNDRDFMVMISLPTYGHHNIGCMVGELLIEDAENALTEIGLIRGINSTQVVSRKYEEAQEIADAEAADALMVKAATLKGPPTNAITPEDVAELTARKIT